MLPPRDASAWKLGATSPGLSAATEGSAKNALTAARNTLRCIIVRLREMRREVAACRCCHGIREPWSDSCKIMKPFWVNTDAVVSTESLLLRRRLCLSTGAQGRDIT